MTPSQPVGVKPGDASPGRAETLRHAHAAGRYDVGPGVQGRGVRAPGPTLGGDRCLPCPARVSFSAFGPARGMGCGLGEYLPTNEGAREEMSEMGLQQRGLCPGGVVRL